MSSVSTINIVRLQITAEQSVTLMPRIMQILSRRGLVLIRLRTIPDENTNMVTLRLIVRGELRWHSSLPELIRRLVDVIDVHTEKEPTDD